MDKLFCKVIGEDRISFYSDGKVSAATQSYEIQGHGYIELTEDDTRHLFVAMAKFYAKPTERKGDECDS